MYLFLLPLSLVAATILAILFFQTQKNILKLIRPENRLVQPNLIYFQITPVAGQIWQFFVIIRLSKSIQNELSAMNEESILGFSDAAAVDSSGKRPAVWAGIAYCTLTLLFFILSQFPKLVASPDVDLIAGFGIIAGVTCWIVYWVQLAGWKRRLAGRKR